MDEKVKKITIRIGDEDRVVEIHKPTPKIEAEANMESSKVFAKLIKEKDENGKSVFMLRSQLNSYLASIGIYSEQDIDDINTFSERIKELEELLRNGGKKKSEGKEAAIELRKLRFAIYSLLMRQSEYDKNTIEHYADNARMDYLVTKCICFEGGAPIFKNLADYESDEFLQRALREPIKELAGMVSEFDPDFEKNLPENKFLKKYGFCDENYRLINKEGKLVDADGNLVDNDGNPIAKKEEVESVGEFLDEEEASVPPETQEASVLPESQDGVVPSDEVPVVV